MKKEISESHRHRMRTKNGYEVWNLVSDESFHKGEENDYDAIQLHL